MATQKRAVKGGEVGKNGEWYPAGSFICTTELRKMARSERKAAARKQQVESCKWEFPPEGMTAIFAIVGTQAEYVDRYAQDYRLKPFAAGVAYYGETRWGRTITDLCEAYNRGERWTLDAK